LQFEIRLLLLERMANLWFAQNEKSLVSNPKRYYLEHPRAEEIFLDH
jgi:hypothetical protein